MILVNKVFFVLTGKKKNEFMGHKSHSINIVCSDCNPRIEFSIPGAGIKKFVIPGSHFRIRLTSLSLFWYLQ